ncbi:methylamine utilization protein [Zoogloea sp.]|uniref:methylamine utilization protein n=1 Tax=Zoogloea sp. TaxID=49181 RepID=UPI00261C5159|nr:methylamine utilization protein [Zoogloea sp.]MDD3354451.1 methylamine utilization protein [Zoogloea sp.]
MTRSDLIQCLLMGALTVTSPTQAADLVIQLLNEQGKGLSNGAVFLESPDASRTVRPLKSAEMAQKDKTFVPQVLIVPRGTPVSFPNRDTVRHHVYSFSSAKRFEIKLYVGTPTTPIIFDQPGVVPLGCNIHDQMLAWILVVDTPYYAVSGLEGKAVIKDVPPGSYKLRSWHGRLPPSRPPMEQAITVGNETLDLRMRLTGLDPS